MLRFRFLFLIIFGVLSIQVHAQEQQLAYQYFRNGSYEKAASMYKSLHEKHPYNTSYLNYLIDCFQQLEEFEEAQKVIEKQLSRIPNQDHLYVELGYNFELQHETEKAIPYYEKALNAIETAPNLGYPIGKTFQDNHLLKYALKAYQKAMKINPISNFNFQIAFIYGEMGEIPKMMNSYLDLVDSNEKYLTSAKNYLGRFIADDPLSEYNVALKSLLIGRMQNAPKNSWNQLLSWLYMQQKEYNKAFIQEKALHKRNDTDVQNIMILGEITFEDSEFSISENCFQYVLDHSSKVEIILRAKLFLVEIGISNKASNDLIQQQFQDLLETYGNNVNTLGIQAAYADFLSFKKNNPELAIEVLKEALKLPINEFQKGHLKTKLADILVFTGKYSTALIYYTQVQLNLKNHVIGQTARFKIAQTSFFKGDFQWAQTQLKVLKKSTSQLIANDALDLNLLITDNTVKDSLKIALKIYAKSELLSYQNKNQEAIDTLSHLLKEFKGHSLEDEALFKQAVLFEKTQRPQDAIANYLQLIQLDNQDILVDDALFNIAELYLKTLNDEVKAAEYYKKILFEYPSSIHLVNARKMFRTLRGDQLN